MTRGAKGRRLLVFNPLGWQRTDAVTADLGFGEGGVTDVKITDQNGQTVLSQVVEATKYWDGGLKTARVAFVARDVPAIGYRVFHALPSKGSVSGEDQHARSQRRNRQRSDDPRKRALPSFNRLVDRRDHELFCKPSKWQVLSGPGNVVSREEDHGDLWEPYRGLDGGSRIAMTKEQEVPSRAKAVYSDLGKGGAGTVLKGPVISEFRVERPFASGKFATTIRLLNGSRRIEVTTRLVNQEKYVRYQAHFPTTIKEGKSTHEIPFGSIDRPAGIEFPAQNWVDYSDGRHGLAL